MAADLGNDERLFTLLANAAEAVRHGDLPLRQSQRHPVNKARARRDDVLDFSRNLVEHAIARRLSR